MKTKIRALILLGLCFSLPEKLFSAQPTGIAVLRRGGQSFLTWSEDSGQTGETYRVYRSTSPISSIGGLTKIAELEEGSSRIRYLHENPLDKNAWIPLEPSDLKEFYMNAPRAIITDCPIPTDEFNTALTTTAGISHIDFPGMLSTTTGLFVWTSKESGATNIYYAVTTVSSAGIEETAITSGQNSLASPVSESKGKIEPVYYYTDNKTSYDERDCYLMWMDYEQYKNCYLGYVFPVTLTRKEFSVGGKMPRMYLDGVGTPDPGAGYSNYGFGDVAAQGNPTWYYGFHDSGYQGVTNADTDGLPDGLVQTQKGVDIHSTVTNFVQHKMIEGALFARRKYNITDPRFYVQGFSMGGAGCNALLTSYPEFVTGVSGSHGITQYKYNWNMHDLIDVLARNYGSPFINGDGALANPAHFIPHEEDSDYSTQLNWFGERYNGDPTHDVYAVKDIARVLLENTAKSFGLFASGLGGADGIVSYCNNGYHFEPYLRNSRHCFSYNIITQAGHGGDITFHRLVDNMRWDDSRPGFSKAPRRLVYLYDKYSADPSKLNGYGYCLDIVWGNKDNSESAVTGGRQIVDSATDWEIPVFGYLKDLPPENDFGDYTVDITPRNLQNFSMSPGEEFTWQVTDLGGAVEASGTVYADQWGLATIPAVPVRRSGAWAKLHKTGGSSAMDGFLVCIGSGVNEIETPLHYDGHRTISLEVLACEPARTIAAISWTKLSGPACSVLSPAAAKTSVSFTTPGTYVFQAACVADNAATGDDTITVTVIEPAITTRFVNTASTPGGDGTTNDTTGEHRAYASLKECVTATISFDPVMNKSLMVIKCCGAAADTTPIDTQVVSSELRKWGPTNEEYYFVCQRHSVTF